MNRIRVVLADDHTLVRRGLSSLLAKEESVCVVGEAEDGRSLAKKVKALKPDIALVDISMPFLNGLDAISKIVRVSPHTRVVVLSMFSDDAYVTQAWEQGAWGYVLKDEATERLISVIQKVAAGEKSFSVTPVPCETCDPLTPREREVLQLIAEGKRNTEIANIIMRSLHTVRNHRARLMRKLGVHSAAELVQAAEKLGLAGVISHKDSMDLPKILKLYTGDLERGLEEALQDPIHEEPSSDQNDSLYRILRYHVGLCDEHGRNKKALGKMLRPSLLMFICDELSKNVERALPAAVAIELVHNFSLIHDDIEDQDEVRRGRPTVWKLIGIPQAINAGDLMYSIAVRNALQAGLDVAESIVESAKSMIEGQGMDIDFEGRWVDVDSYMDMIDKKTGALICCSFRSGGIIAKADNAAVEALILVGRELGRAFQIRDDLLGIWGDGDVTGKPHGSDIRRKKKSFPVALAIQRADKKGRMLLERAYAQEQVLQSDVAGVIELMARLDVRKSAEKTVEEHLNKASKALDLLSLSQKGREMMDELIGYLARREK